MHDALNVEHTHRIKKYFIDSLVNYMEDNSSYSNCVVHDDTFDWGGVSDIIPVHESNNNTFAERNWN